jgi:hypothetical protein
VTRDRRWDFLHDRQKQPVKAWIVERLGEELARELSAWPLPLEWPSETERARLEPSLSERPSEPVLRLALELVRLDLARDFEGVERLAAEGAERRTSDEQAALRLVARFVTERCLALKEEAAGSHLTRADLGAAVDEAERRLFPVTAR